MKLENSEGFTLLESLITVIILVMLCCFSFVSYQNIASRIEADRVMMRLYRALQFARSEAIRRNRSIMVCPGNRVTGCSFYWQSDLLFLIKGETNKNQLLKVFSGLSKHGKLRWVGFPEGTFLQMTSSGFSSHQNGTFYYCPVKDENYHARALFVNAMGRVRFSQDQDHDGIHEETNGKPLNCRFSSTK